MTDVARELEECAYRAWPAAEVEPCGGWRLRFSHGVTRRGNSVLPAAAEGGMSLQARIAAAERFYARRGQRTLFQVSPVAEPPRLDAALAERGFAVEAPVAILVADAAHTAEGGSRDARCEEAPPAGWLALAEGRSRFARAPDVLRGFLARIGPRAGYALAERGGAPVAMGLGVRDGDWAGLFLMLTVPEARRQGAAAAVLRSLAQWAHARGARRLYLQVERDNPAALALYRAHGFRESYGYHYRVAPD